MQVPSMSLFFPIIGISFFRFTFKCFRSVYFRSLIKEDWDRLYIVCEEFLTNFFKYGKRKLFHFCWFTFLFKKEKLVFVLFYKGARFDPRNIRQMTLGLKLMTSLLDCKYRYWKNRNYFCITTKTNL